MRTQPLHSALVTWACLGLACASPEAPQAGSPPESAQCWREGVPAPSPAPLSFPLSLELPVLEGGLTDWAEVALGEAPAVALRVTAPPGDAACMQLDTVEDVAGHPWVTPPSSWADLGSYCESCPQRVSVGVGSGFYVLPSNERPPPAAERLRVRVALRDCETFLPVAPGAAEAPSLLRLEALPLHLPPGEPEGVIRLALAFTPGSVFFDGEGSSQVLEQAVQRVNEALRPGRLRVEVSRTRHLSAQGLEVLSFTPGDTRALKRALEMLRACPDGPPMELHREVPVIFAGCLLENNPLSRQQRRPLGRVTHIPGDLTPAEGADGIFLAGSHCDPGGGRFTWPATTVARLLAHELGHFLGLYHSMEEDGTQDALGDTSADNAMHFNPLTPSARGFSLGQFQVMRRHPAVHYGERGTR